jgi:hypothetical protein
MQEEARILSGVDSELVWQNNGKHILELASDDVARRREKL